MANLDTVAEILEAKGHCPVTRLAELADSGEMNDFQKASIEKWLMEMRHAKPKALEITGAGGGPIQLHFSDADEAL